MATMRPDLQAVVDAAKTLKFVMSAARKQAGEDGLPGLRLTVTVQQSKDEDDDENYDKEDLTISCEGKTEEGIQACYDILAPLADSGHWSCQSTEKGAECRHTPH